MDRHLAAQDELRRVLRRIARRLGLTQTAIDVIVSRTVSVPGAPGALVCGPHDCEDFVRILVQGAAKIVCTPDGGRRFTVRFAAPGDFLCVPQPKKRVGYGVNIVAHEDISLAVLTRAHMLEAIAKLPESGIGTLTSWSFRAPTSLLFAKLASRGQPITHRLAVELQDLAHRFGRQVEQGILIDLQLSRQDLAELVCAEPARITNATNELRAHGLIDRLGRKIIVTHAMLGTEPPKTLRRR